MRKLFFVILFGLFSLVGKSQFRALWFEGSQYFQLGDSVVTVWGGDTLTNPQMVRDLITSFSPGIKSDSSTYSDTAAYASTFGDSIYVSGQDVWIKAKDTINKVDTADFALNAQPDTLFHDDTQVWLSSGDTIPKADSTRDVFTANNKLVTDTVEGNYLYLNLGTTQNNGSFYRGTTAPTNTTRLNYGGNFYGNRLFSNNNVVVSSATSSLLSVSITDGDLGISPGLTPNNGNFYTGTTDPSNTTRLNYDGAFWSTYLKAIDSVITPVLRSGTGLSIIANGSSTIDIESGLDIRATTIGLTTESTNLIFTSANQMVSNQVTATISSTSQNYFVSQGDTINQDNDTMFAVTTNYKVKSITSEKSIPDTLIISSDTLTVTNSIKNAVEQTSFDSLTIDGKVIRYNTSEGVFEFETAIGDVVWQGALEDLVQIYNNSGQAISIGDPVQFTGAIGDSISTGARVGAADTLFGFFAGLATTDIPNNDWGFLCTRGLVRGFDLTGVPLGDPIYLSVDSSLTNIKPAPPNNVLLLGGVVKTGTDGIFYVNWSLDFQRQLRTKTYGFTSQGIGAGTYYKGGFYDFSTTDANLTQAATTQTYGTSNIAYSAHPFVVCGGAGTVDAGVVGLRATGTSIDDQGNQTASDADTVLSDITSVALNEYYEAKKFVGTVTYELITISGSPTTYSLDFNYGYAKYDDFWNKDFYLRGVECLWYGGAADATGFDIELLHHKNTGWTYAATGFEAGNGAIATRSVDQAGFLGVLSDVESAWKRDDFTTFVDGSGEEGILFRITTGANNTIQTMDLHLNVELE